MGTVLWSLLKSRPLSFRKSGTITVWVCIYVYIYIYRSTYRYLYIYIYVTLKHRHGPLQEADPSVSPDLLSGCPLFVPPPVGKGFDGFSVGFV